jgi:hypothetical protein
MIKIQNTALLLISVDLKVSKLGKNLGNCISRKITGVEVIREFNPN